MIHYSGNSHLNPLISYKRLGTRSGGTIEYSHNFSKVGIFILIRLKPQDLRGKDVGAVIDFPELTSDLISLANHLSKATTRKKLGNPGAVIEEFKGKTFEDWERFYEQKRPGALDTASREIYSAIEKLREALELVDEELVRHWVEEAVLKRTYAAWRIQETILKYIAKLQGKSFRQADDQESTAGIDGFIDERPFCVHPVSRYFKSPPEEQDPKMDVVYFEKAKRGLKVYCDL